MAFPASPTNGQTYKDYQYDSSKSCWIKSQNKVYSTIKVASTPAVNVTSLSAHTSYSYASFKNTTNSILINSGYNVSTGVFTAPSAGTYMIAWNGLILTPTTLSHAHFRFIKNGTYFGSWTHTCYNISRSYENLSACSVITLNKDDTLTTEFNTLESAKVYSNIYSGLSIVKVK